MVQDAHAGAVESLLPNLQIDARKMLSSKLLDCKSNGFSRSRKSSVSHASSPGLPTSDRKEFRRVQSIRNASSADSAAQGLCVTSGSLHDDRRYAKADGNRDCDGEQGDPHLTSFR